MKTLRRFFKIIGLLEQKSDLRLQEIADALHFDKSTVYRFLHTALEFGYVRKDEETSRYSLGYKFLNIAAEISGKLDLRKLAHPHLIELEKITGETIHLTLFDGKTVVYIDKVESERPVRMYSRIGNIAPIYCTAVGKIILAYQQNGVIDAILDETELKLRTPNTITDREVLKGELEKIRKRGYATDMQEHENEICCIAAPIRDGTKSVNAAISISAVRSRMNLNHLMKFKTVLLEKSRSISKSLGCLEE